MSKMFISTILSLFILAILPLYALAGPYGCHDKADDIGQACSFATDQDYMWAANTWCMFNANKGVTANNQIWLPSQGTTSELGMTDSKGRKIAMWGNLNVDQHAKGTVNLDYYMCMNLMANIKDGNKNAVSGGCGLTGGWIPYGGNSGIWNSAATSAGVFQGICVTV